VGIEVGLNVGKLGRMVGVAVVGIKEGTDEVGKLDGVGVGFNAVVGVSVGIEVGLNVGKLGRMVGVLLSESKKELMKWENLMV
jgi:hypothetical protein